jgi:hypothetical protein
MDTVPQKQNPTDAAWKLFEKSFTSRRWNLIAQACIDHIPNDPPASLPTLTLTQYLTTEEILVSRPTKSVFTKIDTNLSSVPQIVISEALYWLHKSLHVLGAAEMHIASGLPTWSISSAYQAGYFAARSIMAFLGVGVAEYERVSIAVDLCVNMKGLRDTQITSRGGAYSSSIPIRSIGILFDHNRIWELFQRILSNTNCSSWPSEWSNYLVNIDMATFTHQRHGLHYTLPFWVEDDMVDFRNPLNFREVSATGSGTNLFDPSNTNYTVAVSCVLTQMALILFSDITRLTRRLDAHRDTFRRCFDNQRHPIYAQLLSNNLYAA